MRSLLFFLLISFALLVKGQESGYGILFGAQQTNIKILSGTKVLPTKSIRTPEIGIVGYGNLRPKFGFYSVLHIIGNHGTSLTDSIRSEERYDSLTIGTDNFRMFSLKNTFMPSFKVTERFHLMAGVQIAYILKRYFKGDYFQSENHTAALTYLNESEHEKLFGLGLGSGIAYCYHKWRFQLTYIQGLNNLFDTSIQSREPRFSEYTKATYYAAGISVAYIIPKGNER